MPLHIAQMRRRAVCQRQPSFLLYWPANRSPLSPTGCCYSCRSSPTANPELRWPSWRWMAAAAAAEAAVRRWQGVEMPRRRRTADRRRPSSSTARSTATQQGSASRTAPSANASVNHTTTRPTTAASTTTFTFTFSFGLIGRLSGDLSRLGRVPPPEGLPKNRRRLLVCEIFYRPHALPVAQTNNVQTLLFER